MLPAFGLFNPSLPFSFVGQAEWAEGPFGTAVMSLIPLDKPDLCGQKNRTKQMGKKKIN